jgi:hypothetical protein
MIPRRMRAQTSPIRKQAYTRQPNKLDADTPFADLLLRHPLLGPALPVTKERQLTKTTKMKAETAMKMRIEGEPQRVQ